ncbi:MAG TPA: amidohydrolase [Candidatus Dormibacteraeota bacterium]|nr:amidohydrolase [Candidatus Dormibacteraeota bacterium]
MLTRLVLLTLVLFGAAPAHAAAELLLRDGQIYTVSAAQPVVNAVAIEHGRIVALGAAAEAPGLRDATTQVIELHGRAAFPGFKDSHAHLLELGLARLNVDLTNAADFDEVIARVRRVAAQQPAGTWIIGSGWHEGKWRRPPAVTVRGFPVHQPLSAATPDHPVLLHRADGHALIVNARAMALMHVTAATPAPPGGQILHDAQGAPTGVFVDDAMDLIKPPERSPAEKRRAWALAFTECLRYGITAVDEPGLGYEDVVLVKQLAAEERIPIRLYVMLGGWETLRRFERPEIGLDHGFLTIRSVKLYADGALGSRGAALLAPYTDDPGNTGQLITPLAQLRQASEYAFAHGFQVNTHAIGDRGNRVMLDLYAAILATDPSRRDLRWRIEHAQHLAASDIPRFAQLGVIASMQPIHATSDRPWAPKRLGMARITEGAYVWRKLLDSGAHLASGTDAPVESLDPFANFYAAVTRMDAHGQPPGGFDPGQRMTRAEALRSYTLDGAYATFTERDNGSLELGKNADLVVLSRDIMQVPAAEILQAHAVMTIVAGKVAWQEATRD